MGSPLGAYGSNYKVKKFKKLIFEENMASFRLALPRVILLYLQYKSSTHCRGKVVPVVRKLTLFLLGGISARVLTESFAHSQLVSVSTSIKFPSLDESQSGHPRNFPVLMSLGLDI